MKGWGKVPTPWFGFSATVRELQEGIPPHRPTLAEALRGDQPVPQEVREYLAAFIEGKTKYRDEKPKGHRGRGRPTSKNVIEQEIGEDFIRAAHEDERMRVEGTPRISRGTPTEEATATVRDVLAHHGENLSEDGVRKRLTRARKKIAPRRKRKT